MTPKNEPTLAKWNKQIPRVVVIAAVRIFRDGLAEALEASGRVSIVGRCGTPDTAMAMVREHRPDAAIVDIGLPDVFGLIAAMRIEAPAARLIPLGIQDDFRTILDCARAGAAGYVTANARLEEVLEIVDRTIAGELLCTPRIAAELFARMHELGEYRSEMQGANEPSPLTAREVQVFGCIQRGLSNKEIAAALRVAESTVKNHVHNLLSKLHVDTRARAVARASLRPRDLALGGHPKPQLIDTSNLPLADGGGD